MSTNMKYSKEVIDDLILNKFYIKPFEIKKGDKINVSNLKKYDTFTPLEDCYVLDVEVLRFETVTIAKDNPKHEDDIFYTKDNKMITKQNYECIICNNLFDREVPFRTGTMEYGFREICNDCLVGLKEVLNKQNQ